MYFIDKLNSGQFSSVLSVSDEKKILKPSIPGFLEYIIILRLVKKTYISKSVKQHFVT